MSKKHIPYRLEDGEVNPDYVSAWKLENPDRVRAHNRKSSAKYRKTDAWKEYLNNWRRNWYKENAYLQFLRSIPGVLKTTLIGRQENPNMKPRKMRKDNQIVLENLFKIGWDTQTDLHINHKVSLLYLLEIDPHLDRTIAYDAINLELVTKAQNHSLEKREVGRRTLEAARAMESRYPLELKGLVKLVKSKLGTVK